VRTRGDSSIGAGLHRSARASDLAGLVPKAELVATALLGGVATAAADLQLGVVTWSIGLLLSLNQLRTAQRLERQLEPVNRLAELVALDARCDVGLLAQLVDAYSKVPEPEFAALKDAAVALARDELLRLRSEQSSGELATGAYYHWLLPMLEAAGRGHSVRALSQMLSCEWDDSAAEQRFIEANVSAGERGVGIDRIFVMTAEDLIRSRDNPAVARHFSDKKPKNLRGHFVDVARLRLDDSVLARSLGDGFITFDDRVALIDLHSADGSARGVVTTRSATLHQLQQTFAELMVHSRPLTPQLVEQMAQHPPSPAVR
jgi:hypothetical protein